MAEIRQQDGRLAWLDNGRCRFEEAFEVAEQGAQYPDELGLATWSVVELIEAAVRSGRTDRAKAAVASLGAVTLASTSDWVLGIVARCRALVSEGEEAEDFYEEAVQRLGRTGVPVELARARLLYGEWLRRAGRRVDARAQLRPACEVFDAMNLDGFAERTRRELLATGETVNKRSFDNFNKLTPQEVSICRLASSGYTNPEIGCRLFLSGRTVEWHLRKVFLKLNIGSRRQLRDVMPALVPVEGIAREAS